MINVLIVDDSALIREFLSELLKGNPDINVVAAMPHPYKAVDVINNNKIDVIILDIEMPFMDGLVFLEKIMKQRPIPVIICSSVAEEGSANAIKALQLGAVDVITKAKLGIKDFFKEEKERIIESIKAASKANLASIKKNIKSTAQLKSKIRDKSGLVDSTKKIVAIGASTGGTIVLRSILSRLPANVHGLVITQHMPEDFTKRFSESLNDVCDINVKEAENGDHVLVGNAIIAKGDFHLKVEKNGAFSQCLLTKDKKVNRQRPSVDVMFESIAESAGRNALGILLTGMGKDGAAGLKSIREAGGLTIAQNEESCAVFGMPKAAIETGAADLVLDIDGIVNYIIEYGNN